MKAVAARLTFAAYQAEQFLSLLSRLDPSANPDATFVWWANSKDFCPRDRSAIAREVRGILAEKE
jgi:hypothetical protein